MKNEEVMPEDKSELTIVTEMVIDGMMDSYRYLKEQFPVPYLMQRLPASDYRKRFIQLSPEQQQVEIARLGPQRVYELLAGSPQ